MKEEKISHRTKIVLLTLKDLQRCIELDIRALNGIWNKQQWKEELINPNRVCIGIFIDSKLIGVCCGWVILDQINITLIAIHPSKQRKGLGVKLLSYFIRLAEKIRVKIITLETKESNYPAQALFRKLNFKEIAERQKIYNDGSNALIFQLKLAKES